MSLYESADYKTVIMEYEYSRPTPSSTASRNRKGSYYFPLPINIPDNSYSAKVRDFDLAEIGTTIDTFKDGNSSMTEKIIASAVTGGAALTAASGLFSVVGKITGATSKASDGFGAAAAGAAGVAAAYATAAPYLGAYQGVVRNPHTALLFEGMNMRQITYQFRFTPREEKESSQINSWIQSLRSAMHPEYSNSLGQFALNYPRMFTVKFAGGKMGDLASYPSMDYSFLANMSVATSPQGVAFFKQGQPVIIDLSLTFHELDMKTRESFRGSVAETNRDRMQ